MARLRMSADQRKPQVLTSAMHEFGLGGYDSVSAEAPLEAMAAAYLALLASPSGATSTR